MKGRSLRGRLLLLQNIAQAENGSLRGPTYSAIAKDAPTVLGAGLLVHLLNQPGVPSEFWDDIAMEVVLHYFRLSEDTRTVVVRRFAELGGTSEMKAAVIGFRGLTKVASFDETVWSRLGEGTTAKLAEAYRSWVRKGQLPRNDTIETGLKLKL
jgi:hypothetical protein